jgi:hypothetical protein
MTVLVSVWGAAPGFGKSTLCAGLSPSLSGAGPRVDHFREEEILSRSEFAAVAQEFGATGAVTLGTLVAATARFVESVRARDDVVIADALVPFVPTLLAMGHDEARRHGWGLVVMERADEPTPGEVLGAVA